MTEMQLVHVPLHQLLAGCRRLAAMQQKVSDGKWDPDRPVGCALADWKLRPEPPLASFCGRSAGPRPREQSSNFSRRASSGMASTANHCHKTAANHPRGTATDITAAPQARRGECCGNDRSWSAATIARTALPPSPPADRTSSRTGSSIDFCSSRHIRIRTRAAWQKPSPLPIPATSCDLGQPFS